MAEAKKVEKKTTEEVATEEVTPNPEVVEEVAKEATAKAGKRSKKAVEEEAEKSAKKARKAEVSAKEDAPKAPKYTPKNMERAHSKAYRAAAQKVEAGKLYGLTEAIKLAQSLSSVKFDASLELHVNLGIDARQSDQMVRTSAVLPAGTGKSVRIAVIADEKGSAEAKAAGADIVDAEKITAGIEKGKFDFDVLVTTPSQMAALAKHAKVLGPKGLMPSPKAGTVTNDLATTVKELKAGKVELKNDSAGIIHTSFGKVSFKEADLIENAKAIVGAIVKARPAASKGTYLKAIAVAASMSPSVRVDTTEATKELKTK